MIDNNSLTGLSHFPLETTGKHSYNAVLRWLCDALYRMNVEYDMVSSAERDFSGYDCLVVPALYSASEELLTAILTYVKNGGHLITTFRTGFSDEQLKIYADTQPHILHECLGIHYDQFTYPKDVNVVLANAATNCSNDQTHAHPHAISPAHDWMDLVICDSATPVARYEHPAWNRYTAVAKNHFGLGSTLYLGAFFGDDLLEKILCDYLTETGYMTPTTDAPHFPIIIKRGKNDMNKELFYYFNYSGETQTVCHLGASGTDLLTGQNVSEKQMLTLKPWDLMIVEI